MPYLSLGIIFILIIVLYKLIFSLGFNKRDDSVAEENVAQKRRRTLLSVIQFLPVLTCAPLHFGGRRFFGVPFLCVFPQRRLVNVANFRFGGGRASLRPLLSSRRFDPFVANFRESPPLPRREVACARIKCQIFWKCKQVESPSVPVSGHGSAIFSPFFTNRKFRGLNRETP